MKAHEEVVDLIAAGTSPQDVVAFRPSEAASLRVADLVTREKAEGLTPLETSELSHSMQIEHLVRLAKARARQHLATAS